MQFRRAHPSDAAMLAPLNKELIVDEGHRNPMTIAELEERMRGWLAGGAYEAVLFEENGAPVGYALFRRKPDHVYLRQFLIRRAQRRRGLGRQAIAWLRQNAWPGMQRVRIEVLVGNEVGIAFWRAVGFREYCLTMEMEQAGRQS